jgi:EF hand
MRKHILALASSVAVALVGSGLDAMAQRGSGAGGWHDYDGGGYGRDWRDQRGSRYGSRWDDRGRGYGRGDDGGWEQRRGRREFGRDQGGGGMMRRGMMSHEMMDHGGRGSSSGMTGAGMMSPAMMRIMLALMDTDGDGTVSLSEFQAAHERMFKAMDADKDGRLTVREMQAFFQGRGETLQPMTRPVQQDRAPGLQPNSRSSEQQENRPAVRRDGPPDTGPAQHEEGNPAVPPNTAPAQQENRPAVRRDGPPRTDNPPDFTGPATREP